MSMSNEIKKKMEGFTREQSQHYLNDAEMTYIEKLRKKGTQTKNKAAAKLARFKGRSDKGVEAQNDMLLYMSDYMNDLMSRGISEQDAFEKARQELTFDSQTEQSLSLQDKYRHYYENQDIATMEITGLFYAAFSVLGLVLGALIGFLTGGGRIEFLSGGWIDTLIGTGVGILIGAGLAMLANAITLAIQRK